MTRTVDWWAEHEAAMARYDATPRWRWRRRRIHKQAARSAMWLLLTDDQERAQRRARLDSLERRRP